MNGIGIPHALNIASIALPLPPPLPLPPALVVLSSSAISKVSAPYNNVQTHPGGCLRAFPPERLNVNC